MKPGLRLKLKRIEKGYNQNDLGKVIGVTRQTISLYERGKKLPRPESMKKLASFLNTPVQELFF